MIKNAWHGEFICEQVLIINWLGSIPNLGLLWKPLKIGLKVKIMVSHHHLCNLREGIIKNGLKIVLLIKNWEILSSPDDTKPWLTKIGEWWWVMIRHSHFLVVTWGWPQGWESCWQHHHLSSVQNPSLIPVYCWFFSGFLYWIIIIPNILGSIITYNHQLTEVLNTAHFPWENSPTKLTSQPEVASCPSQMFRCPHFCWCIKCGAPNNS